MVDYSAPTELPVARSLPVCGLLSVIAPCLGFFAAYVIFPYCAEDNPRYMDLYLIIGWAGPTELAGGAHAILGLVGLVGFGLGCIALWRSERLWGFGVLGLLFNGPLLLVLLVGLFELLAVWLHLH
jgi:hypothetical protein